MKRAFIRFWRQLKEPLVKKELLRFIKEGLLVSILFATMLGVLEFLVGFTQFSFLTIFVFIIYYLFLIKRLRGSFHFYHIIYSLLAVVFLIIGDYVMGVSGAAIEFYYYTNAVPLKIFNPIYYFSFLFYWPLDAFYIVINLLNIFIYGIIIYFTFQRMKW